MQEILQTTSVETLALEVRNVFKSTNSNSVANIILGAAELGHLGVYQLVTEKCVDKNPHSLHRFTTPLHKAASRGHLSICQFIVENTRFKNPEICSGPTVGWTPLHFAARSGHVEVCRLIIKYADNPETPNGLTPLHYAARYGHFEVCKLIVENAEDDKNPRSHRLFHGCWTPLEVAKKYGHFKIVRLIRSAILKSGNLFQM